MQPPLEPYAIDFETELIAPGAVAPRPVCLSWANTQGSGILHWTETRDFLVWLLSGSVPVIGANIPFDLGVAAEAWPELLPLIFSLYERGLVHDVQTNQKMIDIASGDYFKWKGRNDLAGLSLRILRKKLPKEDTWRLRYGELRPLPLEQWPSEAVDYSIRDSITTLDVWYEQMQAPADVLQDAPARARAHWALHLMECWGMVTDQLAVEALKVKTIEEMQGLEQELVKLKLLAWNKKDERYTKKRKRAQEMAHEAIGFTGKLTKKGKELKKDGEEWQQIKYLSVDEEACKETMDPRLLHFARYSSLDTFLSGFLKHVSEPQIHTRFDPLMETGRTSSSKPNIQNVRREEGARECFIPRPGHVFIDCDYDGAELHTLAQACINLFGRSNLADALNNGFDPHTGLGAQLAHVSYEQAKALLEQGDDTMKEWRRRAKPGNFGFPGGMGAKGMRVYAKGMNVDMTLAESQQLHRAWQQQWPVVSREYLGWIRTLIQQEDGHAWVKAFDSGLRRGRVRYTQAANFFFQTMAASGGLQAGFAIAKACYLDSSSPLFTCRPVNFIHDEFLLEAPLDRAVDAAWALRDIMVREFNCFTRDCPVSATPCLMDHWSKNAKTIYGADGRLAVWCYAPGAA